MVMYADIWIDSTFSKISDISRAQTVLELDFGNSEKEKTREQSGESTSRYHDNAMSILSDNPAIPVKGGPRSK